DPVQPVRRAGDERAVRHRRRGPARRRAGARTGVAGGRDVQGGRRARAGRRGREPVMSDVALIEGTDYELVVGLEVHVELATATKLFSGSPNRFGDEPN